tara:strand:- start:25 stop:519 length:495 start_codon:yes stop_codon:yes gene_type:complete
MSLRLEDIELIKQLKSRYFRSIDTADKQSLTDMFMEDARICYFGGTYEFEAEGRDNIVGALTAAFHNKFASIHNGHCPEIDVLSDDRAEGIWYLQDWSLDLNTKIATHGAAIYRDKYLKVDGKWKIKESTYSRIYEQVDELKELPNITARVLSGNVKVPERKPW